MQLGTLLFQIQISNSRHDEQGQAAYGSLVNLRRTKKSKEDDHLFQILSASWMSAYFQFPPVCW